MERAREKLYAFKDVLNDAYAYYEKHMGRKRRSFVMSSWTSTSPRKDEQKTSRGCVLNVAEFSSMREAVSSAIPAGIQNAELRTPCAVKNTMTPFSS